MGGIKTALAAFGGKAAGKEIELVIQSTDASPDSAVRAARKLVEGGGVRVNGEQVSDTRAELDWSDALFGRFYVLRRGKKNWHLLVRESA